MISSTEPPTSTRFLLVEDVEVVTCTCPCNDLQHRAPHLHQVLTCWGRWGSHVYMQGMTIRTARLPGAGNLLSRAGEDLSGLPGWASCYQFLYFLLTVSYFNSSIRFLVTVTVFVLRIHKCNISFLLHHQTNRLQCHSMWLACQCS